MSGSPDWKVYDPHGTYQAAVKDVVAAAVLANWYGPQSTVRLGHAKKQTVYTQLGGQVPDYGKLELSAETMTEYEWSEDELKELKQ